MYNVWGTFRVFFFKESIYLWVYSPRMCMLTLFAFYLYVDLRYSYFQHTILYVITLCRLNLRRSLKLIWIHLIVIDHTSSYPWIVHCTNVFIDIINTCYKRNFIRNLVLLFTILGRFKLNNYDTACTKRLNGVVRNLLNGPSLTKLCMNWSVVLISLNDLMCLIMITLVSCIKICMNRGARIT